MGFSTAPRYYDYQGKVAYELDDHNRLQFDLYGSSDKLALVGLDLGAGHEAELSTSTAFLNLGVTWDHRIGPSTSTRLQILPGWQHEDVNLGPAFIQMEVFNLGARLDGYHDLSPRLTLGAGVDLLATQVKAVGLMGRPNPPGQIPPPDFRNDLVSFQYDVPIIQPALWTELVWKPVDGLQLITGLRGDYDSHTQSAWLDPRFSFRWSVAEGTTIKGGVGLYHQAPAPQYALIELGNPDIHQEGAAQYGLGVEQRLGGPVSVDVQLYYKELFGLVLPTDRVVLRDGTRVPERFSNEGTGRSYGAELLLRYASDGRFFGWLSYSLSRTERDQAVVGDLMGLPGGETMDQPHNLVALGTMELPELWRGLSFGFRMRYTTGNPFIPESGAIYDVDTDAYRSIPGSEARRLPAFFQLDLRLDKAWTYDESTLTAYVDLQNVTNRKNVEGVEYKFDYSRWAYTQGLPFFPSIGLRYEY